MAGSGMSARTQHEGKTKSIKQKTKNKNEKRDSKGETSNE
jgi:hypothetical protein